MATHNTSFMIPADHVQYEIISAPIEHICAGQYRARVEASQLVDFF